jgi:phosphoribosylglycinamide formyltransferase-1
LIRIAIIVGTKGRGSNMLALIEACQSHELDAEVVLVISPRHETLAVSRAIEKGVDVIVLNPDDIHFSEELIRVLRAYEVDLVCLAGYTRLLSEDVIRSFKGRILNIHPALLPKYGGPGMYGMKVHEAVIAAREKESGCSVHYVTEQYDEGEILLQLRCLVRADDTPESLAHRVLTLEHKCYVEAVKKWITLNHQSGRKAPS